MKIISTGTKSTEIAHEAETDIAQPHSYSKEAVLEEFLEKEEVVEEVAQDAIQEEIVEEPVLEKVFEETAKKDTDQAAVFEEVA